MTTTLHTNILMRSKCTGMIYNMNLVEFNNNTTNYELYEGEKLLAIYDKSVDKYEGFFLTDCYDIYRYKNNIMIKCKQEYTYQLYDCYLDMHIHDPSDREVRLLNRDNIALMDNSINSFDLYKLITDDYYLFKNDYGIIVKSKINNRYSLYRSNIVKHEYVNAFVIYTNECDAELDDTFEISEFSEMNQKNTKSSREEIVSCIGVISFILILSTASVLLCVLLN